MMRRLRCMLAALVVTSSAACGISGVTSAAPTTTSSAVPPVSAQAQKAGFIDIRSAVPDAVVDLRYATANNFVGAPMYPPDARCLVDRSMAPGLAAAADALRPDVLVFWDCYRPHDVQVRMWEAVPNPDWVARPGPYARSHEAGRSVDVTVASRQQQCPPGRAIAALCLADMGTDFDDFSSRANAFATEGVSPEQQANRARLRSAMSAGGLTVYKGEWWHFDGDGAYAQRPILDVPVN